MARAAFEVVPEQRMWAVRTGDGHQLSLQSEKERAVDFALEWAQANRPSRVILRDRDGRPVSEWTYGADPGGEA